MRDFNLLGYYIVYNIYSLSFIFNTIYNYYSRYEITVNIYKLSKHDHTEIILISAPPPLTPPTG